MAKTKGIYDKNKFTAKTNPRQKQIHDKNNKDSMAETNPRQKPKGFHGRNKSTAKTQRIPHKMGRKEGQFVHKSKDLRSKILMQT